MSISVYVVGQHTRPTTVSTTQLSTQLQKMLGLKADQPSTAFRYLCSGELMSFDQLGIFPWKERETLFVVGKEFAQKSESQLTNSLTVYLRQPDSKTIKAEVNLTSTVLSVKQILSGKYQFPVKEWSVKFRGKELDNECSTLLELGIQNLSILHVFRSVEDNPQVEVEVVFSGQMQRWKTTIDSKQQVVWLKRNILQRTGLQLQDQILVFCGGQLQDSREISQYHIGKDAQLFLLDKRQRQHESREEWLKAKVDGFPLQKPLKPQEGKQTITVEQQLSHFPIIQGVKRQQSIPQPPSPIILLQGLISTDKQTDNREQVFAQIVEESVEDHSEGLSGGPQTLSSDSKQSNGLNILGSTIIYKPDPSESLLISVQNDQSDSPNVVNPLSKGRVHEAFQEEFRQTQSIIIPKEADNYKLLKHCKHAESMIQKSDNTQREAFLQEDIVHPLPAKVTQSMKPKASKDNHKKLATFSSTVEPMKEKLRVRDVPDESTFNQPEPQYQQ